MFLHITLKLCCFAQKKDIILKKKKIDETIHSTHFNEVEEIIHITYSSVSYIVNDVEFLARLLISVFELVHTF